MTIREVEKRLLREGWILTRTRKHKVFKKLGIDGLIVVPNHPNQELAKGTLESIKKAAGWK